MNMYIKLHLQQLRSKPRRVGEVPHAPAHHAKGLGKRKKIEHVVTYQTRTSNGTVSASEGLHACVYINSYTHIQKILNACI